MSFLHKVFLSFFLMTLFLSCKQESLFEKNTVIPNYKWESSFPAAGAFDITDTAAAYNIYIVLRHTDAYRYNNIWLNAGLQSPGDSMQYQKIDLALGNDVHGWEGTGMNDIWEVRKLISGAPKKFKTAGQYRFSIFQIMRDDPLEYMMSAGLRIEKAL